MVKKYFSFLLCIFSSIVFSQKLDYSIQSIPDSLKQNANAVIRFNQLDILITSQENMKITTKRVVSVYNEKGMGAIDALEEYDKSTKVTSIEAIVFDENGKEIKRIKRKDFRDQCVIEGSSLFSDNRILFLNYTPTQFPFTIVYTSEIETSNTAFIPRWYPLSEYNVSLEKSVLNVNCLVDLGFKKKEINFPNFKIQKRVDTSSQLSYELTGVVAQKLEDFSVSNLIFPNLMMGLEKFNLEGVNGYAKDWKEFGKWYSEKILAGTTDLPEETKAKIKSLVGDEKDIVKKAKIVYQYVQSKSRYVSIQVGIGGWKPILASDVDRLGYGDCKALTNYTKALLDVVGVPSYNTLLYGNHAKTNIESDFVSMQGNHMILCVPSDNNNIFLECTSQDSPFGYLGTFTDDRDVLVVQSDGGEIVRTKIYEDMDNTQISTGSYSISSTGDFSGKINILSSGTQFNEKSQIQTFLPHQKESYYKEYWDNINNLKLEKMNFVNDKEKVQFTEEVALSATQYAGITNGKMMFEMNAYNHASGNINRIRNRKTPFEIQRGYVDKDEIEIELPVLFAIEFLPTNFELNTKFGKYKTEIIKRSNTSLLFKRTMYLKKGLYTNKEYDDFRLFMEQVAKNDEAKIILTPIH
ncbi:MAG: hypothetical protein RIT03_1387 [Bacteroidota bacterium]|jgi:transglutaminase-like putative cysteine protease